MSKSVGMTQIISLFMMIISSVFTMIYYGFSFLFLFKYIIMEQCRRLGLVKVLNIPNCIRDFLVHFRYNKDYALEMHAQNS